jgi:hypothetical protein
MAQRFTLTPCSCVRELQGSNHSWKTDCPVVDLLGPFRQIPLHYRQYSKGKRHLSSPQQPYHLWGPPSPLFTGYRGVLSRG